MLEELRIRGLGVIDDVTLPLGPGLTVLTGETGAGKTMVLSALSLLFGGRADSGRVRTGAAQCSVEGVLRVHQAEVLGRVDALGGELDDGDTLVLRRVVSSAGRSRAAVGGAAAPVAVLAELADSLLAVHGQSDQLRLTGPAAQRALLDSYAGIDLTAYAAAYRNWTHARAELADRLARLTELRRESELLRFGVEEIDALDPQPGEDEQLAAQIAKLGQIDALRAAAAAGHDALVGADLGLAEDSVSVASLLGQARRALGAEPADAELAALGVRLAELSELATELGADFARYGEALFADPEALETAQQRRAALAQLVRKYATPTPDLDGVFSWRLAAARRLGEIDVSDEAIAALTATRDEAAAELNRCAKGLTKARRSAAGKLARAVTAELGSLAMSAATFGVEVRARASGEELGALTVGSDGADEIEFQLAAGPGQTARALARSASGGELSRVMLALEVCLAGTDPVPTMVFDEVDAGVGGRAATEVGARLKELAASCQVLVVTHLAQVAAYADTHVVVDKLQDGGVTASDVRVVDGAERLVELARMLGGSDTSVAREHAEELLSAARR